MASSQSQRKPEVAIASVGHFTEAYPNTIHKFTQLATIYGSDALPLVFDLSKSGAARGLGNLKLAIILKFIANNIRAWFLIAKNRPNQVYICYPGIVLAYLCKLIPRRYRPRLYLDAFISIYDTVVTDRKVLKQDSLFARLLFRLEKNAYLTCEKVIVDTAENADHMATTFQIPRQDLHVINLTASPISHSTVVSESAEVTCLFIGTFVPLQGIKYIAQAACALAQRTDIHFKIIGAGQDSNLLREELDNSSAENITWIEQWRSTAELEQEIINADICLGIFGTTEKTQRVWPFKNYLYMAAGKPIITGDSLCARRLARLTESEDFVTCDLGSPSALARSIEALADSAPRRNLLAKNARAFYSAHLSHEVALRKLTKLLRAPPR